MADDRRGRPPGHRRPLRVAGHRRSAAPPPGDLPAQSPDDELPAGPQLDPPAEPLDASDPEAPPAERADASDQAALTVTPADDEHTAGHRPRTDVGAAPASDPVVAAAQHVTSPPLTEEPWAGLPPGSTAPAEPPRPPTEPRPPTDTPGSVAESTDTPGPVAESTEPSPGPATAVEPPAPQQPPITATAPPPSEGSTTTAAAEPAEGSATHREGHRRLPRSARRARTGPAPAGERRGRRAAPRPRAADRRRPVLGGLLAVVLVAVLVLGTLDLVRYARTRGTPAVNAAASQQAVTAAVNAAKPLLAYDYRTPVAQKVAKTAPLLTPNCAAAYTKDLNVLASTLNPLKVVETAQVNSSAGNAGIQKTAKGQVTVLIFAVQTATNSRVTAPSVTPVQVSFTMVRPGRTWLVDGVVAKGSGGSNSSVC